MKVKLRDVRLLTLLLLLAIPISLQAQVIDWATLSGTLPETGYTTNSLSSVGDGTTFVTVDVSRSNSATTGGPENAIAPSQVLTNSFDNTRASTGISGNTYTFTFSEPVHVILSSEEHSELIGNENIRITSPTVGVQFDGSLQNPQAGHFISGNGTSSIHIGSTNNTVTGGTNWTVMSNIAVTSFSIEYYDLSATGAASGEPFTVDIAPNPYIRLDDADATGAGGINLNTTGCSTGWEPLDNTNTGASSSLGVPHGINSMTVTLTNPQNVGQEELSMNGAFPGIIVSGNNSTVITITNDGSATESEFRQALDDIYYVNNSTTPNTAVNRIIDVQLVDAQNRTSNVASANMVLTQGPVSGNSTGPIVIFTGAPATDLFTGLDGTEDAGGTWVDVNSTGALVGSMVTEALLPFGGSVFRYDVTGSSPCSNASTTVVVIKMNGSEIPLSSPSSCAQLTTEYTDATNSANSDDPIFVFSSGSGELVCPAGAAGTIYDWYIYNPTSNSYDVFALASTPTQTGLADGGYLVVRNDGGTIEEGRAWVWNSSLVLDAGADQVVCSGSTVTLGGGATITNPNYVYYDPVPRPLIIDATTEITVTFDANHTYVSDLGFFAVAPDGSTTVTLGPNQGNTCNAGNDVATLSFTSNAVGNVFDFCVLPAPLTGTYDQYFDGTATNTIDWSPFYGLNARAGGWAVQIYDCVGADVGTLTGAIINFDDGAGNVVTYSSGAISVPINDNSCTPGTASIFVVPFTPPVMGNNNSIALNDGVGVNSDGGYEWSYSTTSSTGPWSGPFENGTLMPMRVVNDPVAWFRIVGDNGIGCMSEDVVQITTQAKPNAGTDGFVSLCESDGVIDLFSLLGGSPDNTGTWSGPSALTGGNLGTFDPSSNASGVYSYTVTATAPCTSDSVATVTVQVNPDADAGTNGTFLGTTTQDLFLSLGGTPQAGGTWTPALNAAGTGVYDPNVNSPGVYTYTVTSGNCGSSSSATVTVTGPNDPPILDNDPVTTNEDTSVSGDLTDAGDSDPEGTTLDANTTPIDGPNNGTIVINVDGTFTYTPNADFYGTDTVVVEICDNGIPLPAMCANDTIFVTVTPVNDPPVIDNETITTDINTGVSGDLTDAGDSDVDGNLVVNTTPLNGPSNGTITINGDGTYTYTPNTNFAGQDTVVVEICDDGFPLPAICTTDTIFVTVDPCTDPTDTDGDGYTDCEETTGVDDPSTPGVPTGTSDPNDPCDPDMTAPTCDQDGDGLTNAEEAVEGTDPTNPDTDGDGYNDGEEVTGVDDPSTPAVPTGTSDPQDPCDPDMTAPTCDQDGDGLTNAEEVVAGTDPTNPDTDGDGYNDGEEVTGVDDPSTPNVPTGTSDPQDPCDPDMTAPTCDQDGDGLTNAEEVVAGTDPTNPDTDGDGYNDGEEVTGVDDPSTPAVPTGTSDPQDPCDPDMTAPTCDQDGDGLTNAEEVVAGTDPTNPDTDGDGYNDGEEVTGVDDPSTPAVPTGTSDPQDPCDPDMTAPTCDQDGDGLTNAEEVVAGTDPTNPDTDGDGYNDGEEVTGVDDPSTPAVPTGTSDPQDPCDPDMTAPTCDQDGDGLTNAEEVVAGTDPTNPDTDGDGYNDGEEVTGVDDPSTPNVPTGTSDPQDPCDPDMTAPTCDQDGDGLTNAEEVVAGTDPTNPDTDGDGYNDGEEVTGVDDPSTPNVPTGTSDPQDPCDPDMTAPTCDQDGDGLTNAEEVVAGTDPTNPDTDGDGLTDGEEITGVDDPSTPIVPTGTSDPLDPCDPDMTAPTCDQDGDGLTNAEEVVAGTDPTNPDTDGDGYNDGEEVTGVDDPSTPNVPTGTSDPQDPCDPDMTAPLCDQDGDGLTNAEEVLAGTDPTNPDTDGDGYTDGEEITGVDDPSTPNVPTGISDPIDPCDPDMTSPTCDQDGDGLTNEEEIAAGTDPTNPDSDGDGYNDGEEVTGVDDPSTPNVPTGTSDPQDPCDPDMTTPLCDQDGDGLTNEEEIAAGTDPTNPDTDGDGYTDGEEVTGVDDPSTPNVPTGTSDPLDPCDPDMTSPTCDQDGDGLTNEEEIAAGTDPTNPDTDGDGYTDGEEVTGVDDPSTPNVPTGSSDPLDPCDPDVTTPLCDQDGDGLTNEEEIAAGTDPTNPDTDGDGLNDGEEVTGVDDPSTPAVPTTGTSDPQDPCDPVLCDLDIPEGFTPNGDLTNDYFVIPNVESYPGNELIVFNRWGNKVFQMVDYDNTWDGTMNVGIKLGESTELPTGTYFYLFDSKDESIGDKGFFQGYVYIKR